MKVLVCGGREYQDRARVFAVLDDIDKQRGPITCLIHGAARGADELGEAWARARQVHYRGYPAQWEKHGRSAGPRRNALMLRAEANSGEMLSLVVAFPGGVGTAHMIGLSRGAGIEVMEIKQ